MGSRVPVDHYDLSSAAANSFIGTTLHDLNSGDEVADAADSVAEDNDDRSSAVVSVCITGFFFSLAAIFTVLYLGTKT